MSCYVPEPDRLADRLLASPLREAGALQALALERSDAVGQPAARATGVLACGCDECSQPMQTRRLSSAMSADHEAGWEAKNRLPRIHV